MVRHAPIHRRSGHSDIAICCGRNVLGSSPSTYGGAPLESGHHFESQTIQRIQNVFGRTLSTSSLLFDRAVLSMSPLTCANYRLDGTVMRCAGGNLVSYATHNAR